MPRERKIGNFRISNCRNDPYERTKPCRSARIWAIRRKRRPPFASRYKNSPIRNTPAATFPTSPCRTVRFGRRANTGREPRIGRIPGGFARTTGPVNRNPPSRAKEPRNPKPSWTRWVRRFAKKDTGSQRKTNTRPSRRRSFEMREGTETARSTEPTTSTISPDSSKSPGIRGRTRKT